MNIVKLAVKQPNAVLMFIIISILAGVLAFNRVPIQMTPNVDTVVISVNTFWENASPEQIESDIVIPQEKALSNLTGLSSITSTSQNSSASVRLEFEFGVDINKAKADVVQRLNQVPIYPQGVSQPIVSDSDPSTIDYIAWVGLAATDPDFDNTTLKDFMDRNLKPRLENIKGISNVGIFGTSDKELQIRVDPEKLAAYAITYSHLVNIIQSSNATYSAGRLPDGKNDILIKAEGRFRDISSVENIVLQQTNHGFVYLKDVAQVIVAYKEMIDWVRVRGIKMPFMSFELAYGANLLETMQALKSEISELNKPNGILDTQAKKLGINGTLEMVMSVDTSTYVENAIDLVQSNILVGGFLAIIALVVFLRSIRAVGVIAIAIPISIISSVVVLVALGRSINIVSLAGMAFAVGMVVDNAIVVIENIYRHLEMGKRPLKASIEGCQEVAGAVFASTLTTLVVFVPILLITDNVGQLFRDISFAIMSAVLISFIVSILVIPSAAAIFLRDNIKSKNSVLNISFFKNFSAYMSKLPIKFGNLFLYLSNSKKRKIITLLSFIFLTFLGIALLIPPLDYLPKGNRNSVYGLMITPPGYNLEQISKIGTRIENEMRHVWQQTENKFQVEQYLKQDATSNAHKPAPLILNDGSSIEPPKIENYFLAVFGGNVIHAVIPEDPNKTIDSVALLNNSLSGQNAPDVFGTAFQEPLFKLGGTTGSAIQIDLLGNDLQLIKQSAASLLYALGNKYGPYAVIPDPVNFTLLTPQISIHPNDERLSELNMTRRDLGLAIQTNGDGVILMNSYSIDGELKNLKIVTNAQQSDFPLDSLFNIPMATPSGKVVDLQSLSEIKRTNTTDQIKHVARQRAITLQFTPPSDMPLEKAINSLEKMVSEMKETKEISPFVDVNLSGSAGKLTELKRALLGDGTLLGTLSSTMFLALFVIYLVMVILFQSWLYPIVILVAVPLATLGGFLGLSAVHWASILDRYTPVQNFDVLTLLGFIILSGVVVNNAILIVHQALNNQKVKGMEAQASIKFAIESRVRPIMMSMLTSVGGMLPLVMMTGAGSELYRGLGSVVVGGLFLSTIFTLILVPVLLSLFLDEPSESQQPCSVQEVDSCL